jgi:hypothetical protein
MLQDKALEKNSEFTWHSSGLSSFTDMKLKGGFRKIPRNTFLLGHTSRKPLESENGNVGSEDDACSTKTGGMRLLWLFSLPALLNRNWPSPFVPQIFIFTNVTMLLPFFGLFENYARNVVSSSTLHDLSGFTFRKSGKQFQVMKAQMESYSSPSSSMETYGKWFRICSPIRENLLLGFRQWRRKTRHL